MTPKANGMRIERHLMALAQVDRRLGLESYGSFFALHECTFSVSYGVGPAIAPEPA
jgi:hypothetical protein